MMANPGLIQNVVLDVIQMEQTSGLWLGYARRGYATSLEQFRNSLRVPRNRFPLVGAKTLSGLKVWSRLALRGAHEAKSEKSLTRFWIEFGTIAPATPPQMADP